MVYEVLYKQHVQIYTINGTRELIETWIMEDRPFHVFFRNKNGIIWYNL